MTLTPSQIALQSHLAAEEARIKAWVAEDPENRWATCPPSTTEEVLDLAKQGITSVEEYELDSARNDLWEVYKDIHGISPRWLNIWEMSMEQVKRELDLIAQQSQYHREAEELAERKIREAMTCKPMVQKLFT